MSGLYILFSHWSIDRNTVFSLVKHFSLVTSSSFNNLNIGHQLLTLFFGAFEDTLIVMGPALTVTLTIEIS